MGDHTESVEIHYDPKETDYRTLLKMFWENHDSTACHSRQYMSGIFYHNKEQERLAQQTKEEHQKTLAKKIVTRIVKAETFYDAEDYHQKYLLRQKGSLLNQLGLSEEEIKNSHVCTRLNGYCGGYGKTDDLEKEIESFGLSESGKELIRNIASHGPLH